MGNFREESRLNWKPSGGVIPSDPQLQVGCLQRIADAAEKLADGFNAVLKERDHYKAQSARNYQWGCEEREKVLSRDRQIANLRGQITKLKKRL